MNRPFKGQIYECPLLDISDAEHSIEHSINLI
jgi:hypothetical protein